jgi:hypothetical protein
MPSLFRTRSKGGKTKVYGNNFDLGVCMKAYPVIWNQPKKFEDHIIMIGTFNVVCTYFKMIGKKMEGTGLLDILLEAGLIGSGLVRV